MQITRTARAEQFEIKLKGRMDATWSDHVARTLAECVQSGQHVIAVDMAEVDYISSAGIRILVMYARKLKSIQGRFCVINASNMVQKVLELAGLEALLQTAAAPVAEPSATRPAEQIALAQPGAVAEVFELEAQASLQVRWPGDPTPWLAGGVPSAASTVEFPANALGIGLGALGDDESEGARFGEFLAAAGAVICQPADGSNKPDYMLLQGALTPAAKVAYGMLGQGGFRRLLRFDKGPQASSLPFSAVVKACLDAGGGEAVGLVIVAETASLIGASLQKAPSGQPATGARTSIFTFPGVREWLSFTAEAAFANTTSLVVGFAASQARGPGLRLLKPLVSSGEISSGEIHGHFHAAAFPYQPLRKGKVDLGETVRPLFESGQILGVLHLLNDWREINGAGESRFLRGACWCAPLVI